MQALIAKLLASQLGPVLKQLKSQTPIIAVAVLASILIYQNVSDTRWVFWADTIPYLRNELTESEFALDLALQSNETLTKAIQETTDRITAWEEMSTQFQEENRELQNQLAEKRSNTNTQVRTVIQEITPSSCKAAFEYLRDSIPDLNYGDLFGDIK